MVAAVAGCYQCLQLIETDQGHCNRYTRCDGYDLGWFDTAKRDAACMVVHGTQADRRQASLQ